MTTSTAPPSGGTDGVIAPREGTIVVRGLGHRFGVGLSFHARVPESAAEVEPQLRLGAAVVVHRVVLLVHLDEPRLDCLRIL